MSRPDFIIGGAPRSGTTWLYELLDRHPGVYMAKPVAPEPKFFLVDELYAEGPARYQQWFEGAAEGQIAGEKSTNYLESAQAAGRMARDIPGVKLIFILREPADRAWSNYLWSRMNGHEHESFEDALAHEDARERACPPELRYARPHAYFSRGLYAQLLSEYFARFPREQIICLRFEDLRTTPEALTVRLHRFLGVQPRPADAAVPGVVNPSAEGAGAQDPASHTATIRALRARYAEPNRRLADLLGPDFAVWEDDGR